MVDTAVFDVDGTLVDTNYQHALAWYRAFRRHDLTIPVWRLHRAIGMGGDQLVQAVAGADVEAEHGDALREAWTEEYDPMMPEVQPFAGARELLVDIKKRGFKLVLASSGKQHQVEYYLDLLDGKSVADAWTTSNDVEKTKPEPDLLQAAVGKVEGASAVMVGDSVWDCEAARKISVPSYAVRTGGFSVEELGDAGAEAVYDSLDEMREQLGRTLFASPG